MSTRICIIGTGYVGLVTGACFAEVGHQVVCVDNDLPKVALLRSGGIPIYEPSLEEMVQRNTAAGRLRFSGDIAEGVRASEVIFIAVPTPPRADGSVVSAMAAPVSPRTSARSFKSRTSLVANSTS